LKHESEPLTRKRKHRASELWIDESSQKFGIKPSRTFGSSLQLDLIDIFSNNVISERIRKDPRENEESKYFETVQEWDSEDSNEILDIIDEDKDFEKSMSKYINSVQIHGSNISEETFHKNSNISQLNSCPVNNSNEISPISKRKV